METKIKSARVRRIRIKCGFDHDLYVEPEGLAGGLAVWWKGGISLTVLYKSKNIIHTVIESTGIKVLEYATFVYGPPKERERRVVWDVVRGLSNSIQSAWLLVGGFNDLLSQSEKEGGNPRSLRKIINFQRLLSDCNVMDLEFKGARFTWCNKRPGTTVRERLDRALGNVEFREEFDHAMVFHIDPVGSNHHILVIDCCFLEVKSTSYFKFEANWIQHEDFLEVVRKGWNEVEGPAENRLSDLVKRLEACKKKLVAWSKIAFPNFKRLIDQLKRKLDQYQSSILTEQAVREAEEVTRELEVAWAQEESYWWQRSRISWLKCGDRNTKFFHSSVVQRRLRNKVLRLKNERGIWLEERREINEAFNTFYQKLFSSVGSRQMEQAVSYVSKMVTEEENASLMRPVTNQEIEESVFQVGAHKAPGPDGYSAVFYHAAWKEISNEVCGMVKDIFEGKSGLSQINATNIVLIPKVDKPEEVHHFRPLGLCNVSYKIIAKILTNRMKDILSRIISPHQRAFIKGRMIQDNLILTHEAFHFLRRKKKSRKWEMALKIDMNKAYDRVEWDFLEAVMLRIGFCQGWVSKIMACITTSAFTLQIDGCRVSEFKPGRGVRQGDPLSPYMFVIASKVLSNMLQKHVARKDLKGVKLARDAPVLSHCFFADDAILFASAEESN
ncbi:hypothetical protein QN277_028965 [Acacia crassicarpa]|uniref:Reverse transcriptase domain-containing protein n=1 Tax=Acacia crassicarpa TaxID=499986 RepID=A0AAE1MDQ8_9FABA|nr:hypothetical protein QN277_028965 [Acacia crassicarpa]